MLHDKYNAFRPLVNGKKIFKYLSNFPLFYTLRGQLLDLNKSEYPFPIDASYQIWLKSDYWWFWRRNHLKEKLTPDRRTDGRRTLQCHKLFGPGELIRTG